MNKIEINSLYLDELEDFFLSLGEKKFRAGQMFEFLHKNKNFDLQDNTVFSEKLKNKISENSYINKPVIEQKFSSNYDGTVKYLLRLEDDQIIESVFMPYEDRNTICISSQVGCKMGCKFCASTKASFVRSLSPAEIVSQVYLIENDLDEKISSIVLMGIGEPLDNYDNVIKAIRILNDEKGKNLGQRHITLSTSGLADKVRDLAEEDLAINLAISLHYPFDDQRASFMPVNHRYKIRDIIAASDYYFEKTGRRVSYEYVLIEGLNDTDDHINELVNLFRGKNIHINLIPLNEIAEFDYKSSENSRIEEFNKILNSKGLNSTVRNKKGFDIDAACGQLRISYKEERTQK